MFWRAMVTSWTVATAETKTTAAAVITTSKITVEAAMKIITMTTTATTATKAIMMTNRAILESLLPQRLPPPLVLLTPLRSVLP